MKDRVRKFHNNFISGKLTISISALNKFVFILQLLYLYRQYLLLLFGIHGWFASLLKIKTHVCNKQLFQSLPLPGFRYTLTCGFLVQRFLRKAIRSSSRSLNVAVENGKTYSPCFTIKRLEFLAQTALINNKTVEFIQLKCCMTRIQQHVCLSIYYSRRDM